MKFLLITILIANSFIAFSQSGSVLDTRDGNNYRTVKIKNTNWMIDNLEFDTEKSIALSKVDKDKYNLTGRYYDMSEFATACPVGWRIPEVSDWLSYFQYIADEQSPALALEVTTIDKPVHYTIANYSDKIDLFSEDNLINLQPTGRIEGGVLNIPTDYADYWTIDKNEEAEGRSHIHFMNAWTTIHSHKHHLKPNQKKKLRKFMIRCVAN